MAYGPQGTNVTNFDSYVTATPPTLPPAPPKQINAGDKKFGPPKPNDFGGTANSGHHNRDSYFE